ncbi:5-oxoprolinase subunit PxpB [Gaetbulibacter aquiaggeris]|uniref:5-oxoprolinase subunit PxpB n=1 Tax=Gaetbulibacter aquiaggeris TaxID=1735373 RepID=A0ABW7MWN9_9FLAO
MAYNLSYKRFGERAILIEWPAIIDKNILKDIIHFKDQIYKKKIKQIVELKLAYNSLLIIYDSICRNFENEVKLLKKLYESLDLRHDIVSKLWKIPVCYDAVFGIDLEAISMEKELSIDEIIKRHSQSTYTVYFIGFLPGFLYLGGLNKSLFVPRKATPRLKVEQGSVAIGGNQTGVYPNESPGGWNIIGNSPVSFFDVSKKTPCFSKPGDQIIFYPITLKDHENIKILVDTGVYQMESEVIDA